MKKIRIIISIVLVIITLLIVNIIIIKNKEKQLIENDMVANFEIAKENNTSLDGNEEKRRITIYDIEDGFLTVPYNEKAKSNEYNFDKWLNRNNGYYYYEDDKYISKIGIDVSSYQGIIDWQKVKNSGIEFAIIRLGFRGYGEEGKILLDSKFEENYQNAKKEGIDVGVYFFSQAINKEEVEEEAQFVLENIREKKINYPVVFDLEKIKNDTARTDNLTEEDITNFTLEFCNIIKNNEYTPSIYGNAKTFTLRMRLELFNDFNKWYADYQEKPLYPYDFNMWQYTESGNVDGIDGNVDLNIHFVKKEKN